MKNRTRNLKQNTKNCENEDRTYRESQRHATRCNRERDNVVYWKTKRKINDDLQCCNTLQHGVALGPCKGYLVKRTHTKENTNKTSKQMRKNKRYNKKFKSKHKNRGKRERNFKKMKIVWIVNHNAVQHAAAQCNTALHVFLVKGIS